MGQFDITPVDPMGTLQDWRQVQANTQIRQEQAQQQSLVTKQTQMALQQATQQKKQEDQLLAALQKIPQSLPIYEQMGERSRLLMEAGKFKEAETVERCAKAVNDTATHSADVHQAALRRAFDRIRALVRSVR